MAHNKTASSNLLTVISALESYYGANITVYHKTSTVFVFKLPTFCDKVFKIKHIRTDFQISFAFYMGDAWTSGEVITNERRLANDNPGNDGVGVSLSSYTFFYSNKSLIMLCVTTKGTNCNIIAKLKDGRTSAMSLTSSESTVQLNTGLTSIIVEDASSLSICLAYPQINYGGKKAIRKVPISTDGVYASPFNCAMDASGNPAIEFDDIFLAEIYSTNTTVSYIGGYHILPMLNRGVGGVSHGNCSLALKASL